MFPDWWTAHFGSTPPQGHRLRAEFPQRWFRIHSLPDSKRYPETDEEHTILLDRHTRVASALIKRGAPCTLLTVTYGSGAAGDRSTLPDLGERVFECIASFVEPDEPYEPYEPLRTSFWACSTRWDPPAERALVASIAQDECRAAWLNPDSGEVYAPYDGGADLIVSSRGRRDQLREKFRDWLSSRPDGL